MAKKKKARKKPTPPCPDPERYILVKTKEGNYWRLKRGLNKRAVLNDSFSRNAENVRIASPAAKKLLKLLEPHLRGLYPGRIISRITGRLVKCINKTSSMDLSALNNFDFQEDDHPIANLLNTTYNIKQEQHAISVQLAIGSSPVKKYNNLVTECYFDIILVSGDLQKPRSLRIDSTTSKLFKVEYAYQIKKIDCIMSLDLPPKKSWMLLFKVSCLEGNELAAHPRNYGMKVVRVGSRNWEFGIGALNAGYG